MLALSKFQEIEQQLNEQIAGLVTDAKNQIEVLHTTLRNIALRYPAHESVKLHLTEYLPKNEIKEIVSSKKKPVTSNGIRRGRPRIRPILCLEYNDGESIQIKPNPSRIVLAKLIQENPSGVSEIATIGDFNQHITVKHDDSEFNFRFANPLPLNSSGVKSVSVC